MDERPTFGSLFAGIGGIDLGLERAGWRGRWQVENAAYPRRVLERHWPDVTRYGDIHEVDWSTVEPVDLVAGGFPCQPVSKAGRRRTVDDPRWLWPEFARCLRVLRPRLALVENVRGLVVGRGMGEVLGDLADLGYDAEWSSLSAADVGAPHLRERIFILAYPRPDPVADADRQGARKFIRKPIRGGLAPLVDARTGGGDVADPDGVGWDGRAGHPRPSRRAQPPNGGRLPLDGRGQWHDDTPFEEMADPDDARPQGYGRLGGDRSDAGESPSRPGGRALDEWWLVEPNVGRVAHGISNRVDRLRALGNAVVPQVAEHLGRLILEAHPFGPVETPPPRPARPS